MKRILALIIALILVLSLVACGGNETQDVDTDNTSSNAEQSDTAKDTEQAPQEKVDVPEELVGTWNLMPEIVGTAYSAGTMRVGQTSLEREDAIQTFTVSADGKITVDGTEYVLSNVSESDKENYNTSFYRDYVNIDSDPYIGDMYTVNIDGEPYTLLTIENSILDDLIYFEPRGNLVAQYKPLYTKKAVQTIELSLDNWQEFFEPRINYSLNKNDWDDITGVYVNAGLCSKDGITILSTQDARIEGVCRFTDYATIHFEPKTEEYTLTDVTAYEEPYEYSFDEGLSSGGISFYDVHSELLDITDSEITAKVDSYIYVEVNRIRGTITYLQ